MTTAEHRAELERQLLESEQRYHAFTELTSDFCHVCSRTGNSAYRVQWIGGQFERITGYSEQELYDFGCWLPLVHPEDRERIAAGLLKLVPGDEVRTEFRLVRKDQHVRWIREHSRCVLHPSDPNQLQLYGTARDVTAAREDALALQTAENAYRTIFNATNDVIFIMDAQQGMIIDCNKQALQLFGRPREELIGSNPVQLSPPDHPTFSFEQSQRHIQAALEGEPQLFEWLHVRPDNSTFWTEVSLRATEINGRPRLLAVVRDISERKRLDAVLRESEHRFRALVENVPHLPVQGYDRQRRVIFWNHASELFYGYSCEEAMGRQLEDLIIPAFMREAVVQAVQQWVDEGVPIPAGELQLQHKSGQLLDVFSSHAMLRNIKGELEMYCIDFDITQRKQAALELQRTRDAAQAATVAKNEFLANMSHEVRTPLNGIMGLSQLLRTTSLTEEQAGYMDMLDGSARNLLALINDILDISRIEAGSLAIQQTPFSLTKLLREVAGMYEKPAAEKGIDLDLLQPDDLPPALVGDPLRLKQVLINLVGNAIKFTSHGGVSVHIHRLYDSPQGSRLRFEVRDSGIGMAPEALQKIFNPFTQADASTARNHGGSGLGLAICRRLSELMGGCISAESSLGEGSCFVVELPFGHYTGAQVADDAKPPMPALQLDPLQILLVEDQEVNRTFLQRLLERQGHRIAPAVDGLMALDLLEREQYDLVLLDIQMPGMGGEEVLLRLRQSEQASGRHLPVIALTAHALAGDKDKLLESGFDGYISKPVQMEQLLAEMGRVVAMKGNFKG
ncbi:MAG: PAS domain S-box protein [Trichlorobacter sp.]|uniref:PAS domain S-box protein n=1 Tax=Trichlorobacter sp. TaxID=2911007 RepID=UPI00256D1866|nr:PAS domain S-box protein [Trichlorobacter sp.]MDK9716567.1 PAS domain S-box protein [Trichlorobacter sp.]